MKTWSRFPVFRVLIPFSIGILSGNYLSVSLWFAAVSALCFLIISILFTVKKYATGKFADRWLAGIPFYCCFLALGCTITLMNETTRFSHNVAFNNETVSLVVQLQSAPDSIFSGYKTICLVKAIRDTAGWHAAKNKLLIYIKDSSHVFSGIAGETYLISGRLQSIPFSTNPGAFNYRRYMESKGVIYQCFVAEKQYDLLRKNENRTIFNYAQDLRQIMLSKIQYYLQGNDREGVAGALLLGYDNWLDPELEKHYTAAGVLHVLCVSGMHVGLVYFIFGWMLQWMNRNALLRNVKFLLLIGFVWFYSMVTGLAPSIVRAASMISIVIVGSWIDKKASIYNILCTSCMLLFAFDPTLILDAGFQLSFLAVCGIVFFHPMIRTICTPKNHLLQKGWELISISIAAQLSTFPLSVYLFHQFPNYFILGNLFIVPLSTIVMYSGLALLVTDFIPFAGYICAYITRNAIDLLNFLVSCIGSLPGSVTSDIYLTLTETILLYLLLILVPLWITFKNRFMMFASLLTLLTLFTFIIYALNQSYRQNSFTVYQARRATVASLINDRKAMLFQDSNVDEKQLKYSVSGHLVKSLIVEKIIFPVNENKIYEHPESKIVIIKNWLKHHTPSNSTNMKKVQLLVIGGNVTVPADTILQFYHPAKVIFDSSCRNWQVKKLQEGFNSKAIQTHDVKRSGAYQLNLDVIR